MQINKLKVKQELSFAVKLIKIHKHNIKQRHPGEPQDIGGRMFNAWDSQSELVRKLKPEATVLCALTAHSRGKIHFQGLTYEEQERFLFSFADKHQIGLQDFFLKEEHPQAA